MKWVSEWLLFNTNSAIFQLYHGENFNFQWDDDDEVRFVLDQHAELDFYSANWNNMSPHSDTLSWFRANQSLLFLLNAAWLAEKQHNYELWPLKDWF